MSINKLLTDLHLFALFTPGKMPFSGPSTKLTMAIAPVDSGLYQFKSVDQVGDTRSTKGLFRI